MRKGRDRFPTFFCVQGLMPSGAHHLSVLFGRDFIYFLERENVRERALARAGGGPEGRRGRSGLPSGQEPRLGIDPRDPEITP